jgi:hypothetical protein
VLKFVLILFVFDLTLIFTNTGHPRFLRVCCFQF